MHVWLVDLDAPADADATLSADERARAARFRVEAVRRRFVNGRIAMRDILSRYTDGRGPADLEFAYGPHGRPSLAGRSEPHFNFTRSGSLALCAVARIRDVGVDIEQVRPIPEAGPITRSHFSAREQALLASLDVPSESDVFQQAFYDTWTRKEAFIKAIGLGLAQPLDAFSVTMLPGQRPRLLEVPRGRPTAWTLRAFSPVAGYQAALAIRARGVTLRFWRWNAPGNPRARPLS
ncbi:MAG TPA: 4'-phosphopantetheinyl transferase superfamily protein [Polyangia bacterium]|nr:4'-phosphopantetheinyl transferase superfamily protein [Polyangia bacterium]